jgi:hypothetical protein
MAIFHLNVKWRPYLALNLQYRVGLPDREPFQRTPTLTLEQAKDLADGKRYYKLHTSANAGGETGPGREIWVTDSPCDRYTSEFYYRVRFVGERTAQTAIATTLSRRSKSEGIGMSVWAHALI